MGGYQELKELWILKDCKQDTCRDFIQYGKIVTYPRNRFCIRAREENSNIFFILEGKVQIYNLTKCGKKKILFVLGKHNIANESLVADFNTIFCETLEKCSFFVIRKDRMMQLMEQDFALTKNLFRYQERKLWRLGHQLKNTVGSIYLERKLASKLWKLARDFGIPSEKGIKIDMDLPVTFLADLLGVPRETASRVCGKLQDFGLIIMEKKKIYIPDPAKMAAFYRTGEY